MSTSEPLIEEQVWDQLRTCYDPEIPVNIVDLGLIYDCRITPAPDGGSKVQIRMTLTAPGCSMGQMIITDVQNKIKSLQGVKEIQVELAWEPPWNPDLMSEAARLELGWM